MGALFGLLTIIVLSIFIVRIGAVAFELTGLNQDVAAFQAQSAFSGVGFTTTESEAVVTHPVRRRIARVLILLGSAGFTSSIATLILTFTGQKDQQVLLRIGILGAGLLIIFLLTRSHLIHGTMKKYIAKALRKYAALNVLDYQEVLGLQKGYSISRFKVKPNSWISGCSLKQLNLHLEGLTVLSITRLVDDQEKFIGVPTGDTVIQDGDELICYGRKGASENLSHRPKGRPGDKEHVKEKQKKLKVQENVLKAGDIHNPKFSAFCKEQEEDA